MYEKAKNYTLNTPFLRKSLGVIFLVFGIIFLVTPLTPGGIIITLIGLELLGLEFILTRKLREKIANEKETSPATPVIE